jgi:DNA repair protein RecO (recombination protein O)
MPAHESEAIVLRQYSLSDSDRIIVFVTREHGKVRGVAQGVKKPTSRMAGSLEPLNHIHLEFFSKEGRELSQIRQAEIIHAYLGKSHSLVNVYAFSYFAEIANEMVQESQPNAAFFRLLLACLKAGEENSANQALIRYYEIWSLKLSGLLPNYAYCSNCGKCVKDDGFFAWIESGQVQCHACAGGRGLGIGAASAASIEAMMKYGPGQFMTRPLSRDSAVELERLSQRLLGLQLERGLKSYRMLREILSNPEDSNAT